MIGSSDINKVIRRVLSPTLRQHGFTRVQTRHNWGSHGSCTWVLDIRAVGSYFSDVTGWPPMSVGVWLGVYYDFVPGETAGPVRLSRDGKPLPQEAQCHRRSHLNCAIDQRRFTSRLSNPAERTRTDLWWIERDGSGVDGVVEDIARQFVAEGLPWFERMTDLYTAYEEIRQEPDCLSKLILAAYLAKRLNREEEYRDYREMLEREAQRIGSADLLAQCT